MEENISESILDVIKILYILSKDEPYALFEFIIQYGPVTRRQIESHTGINKYVLKTKLNVLIKNQLISYKNDSYIPTESGKMIYGKISEFIQMNDSLYNK